MASLSRARLQRAQFEETEDYSDKRDEEVRVARGTLDRQTTRELADLRLGAGVLGVPDDHGSAAEGSADAKHKENGDDRT